MGFSFKIKWSEKSLQDLDQILDYLEKEWTKKEIQNFKEKLFNRIEIIGKYPKIFKASEIKPQLRRSVLSKQTSIFYQIQPEKKTISIVRLFDNRMDINRL
ncbi:type II toxin-antitoxin system RelE/ParE family toxin [Gracilimonas sp.]|uniref:type II toxin-antitoxin system RelE/ParE family toxin n=1 Tax=Gracilimonas sp. TaxID=1974203 RepID=UPI003752B23A